MSRARPRMSIAALMLVVLAIAIGIAALRNSTPLWTAAIFTFCLAALGAAALGVCQRRGGRRAFWVGFWLFGWGYLIVAFGPWFADEWRPRLITTMALNELYPRLSVGTGVAWFDFDSDGTLDVVVAPGTLYRDVGNGQFTQVGLASTSGDVAALMQSQVNSVVAAGTRDLIQGWIGLASAGDSSNFQRIGHALSALLAALVGGIIARRLYTTRDEPTPIESQ